MPEAAVPCASPQASPSKLYCKTPWAAQSLMGAVVPLGPRRVPNSGSGGAEREREPSHASGGDATAAGRRIAANRLNGRNNVSGFQSRPARSHYRVRVLLRHFIQSRRSP